jgi:hypothetical protein
MKDEAMLALAKEFAKNLKTGDQLDCHYHVYAVRRSDTIYHQMGGKTPQSIKISRRWWDYRFPKRSGDRRGLYVGGILPQFGDGV